MIQLSELRLGNTVLAAGRIHFIHSISDNQYDPIRLIDQNGARLVVNGRGRLNPYY